MNSIKEILKGRVVVLCVGNKDRGDDGIGPRLASQIKGKIAHEVIDAGVTPENYTGLIARLKPDTIIIVDAIYFEGKPGEVKLFSREDLRTGKISTHDISPKLLIEYLELSTGAKIYMLGVKPLSSNFGKELSKEVESSLKKLEKLFLEP